MWIVEVVARDISDRVRNQSILSLVTGIFTTMHFADPWLYSSLALSHFFAKTEQVKSDQNNSTG